MAVQCFASWLEQLNSPYLAGVATYVCKCYYCIDRVYKAESNVCSSMMVRVVVGLRCICKHPRLLLTRLLSSSWDSWPNRLWSRGLIFY